MCPIKPEKTKPIDLTFHKVYSEATYPDIKVAWIKIDAPPNQTSVNKADTYNVYVADSIGVQDMRKLEFKNDRWLRG